MPDVQELWLFVLAGMLLNLTPGPDMALVIGRGAQSGTRAGIAAALGIGAGCFVHIAAATLGLSAILASSAVAFTVLKWVGAAYLIWLGLGMLLGSMRGASMPARAAVPTDAADLRSIFLQGLLTNVLNPKVALFFLAFLPQFIRADAASPVAAFLLLGLIFNLTGTAWNLAVAWGAGRMAASAFSITFRLWLERLLGAVFVAVGIRLAIAERS